MSAEVLADTLAGRASQFLPKSRLPRPATVSQVDARLAYQQAAPRKRGVRVIIQIPCFNEEHTLPETLAALPRRLEGVDEVEYLVINDGSTDATVEVARRCGVHHILDVHTNRGLADVFGRGLQLCLALGADVIVNTDGDNQYDAGAIPRLVAPILAGKADMVIGDRRVANVPHFSPIKRWLQTAGSRMVSALARTPIPDATSGFRAYSRDAALNMVITGTYTYTLESILVVSRSGMAIRSVPIASRAVRRKSRLFRNIPEYLWRAGLSMFRAFLFYNPALVFVVAGMAALLSGLAVLGGGWLLNAGPAATWLGTLACSGGVSALLMSVLADIINSQRRYNREILLVLRRHALLGGSELDTAAYIRNEQSPCRIPEDNPCAASPGA